MTPLEKSLFCAKRFFSSDIYTLTDSLLSLQTAIPPSKYVHITFCVTYRESCKNKAQPPFPSVGTTYRGVGCSLGSLSQLPTAGLLASVPHIVASALLVCSVCLRILNIIPLYILLKFNSTIIIAHCIGILKHLQLTHF